MAAVPEGVARAYEKSSRTNHNDYLAERHAAAGLAPQRRPEREAGDLGLVRRVAAPRTRATCIGCARSTIAADCQKYAWREVVSRSECKALGAFGGGAQPVAQLNDASVHPAFETLNGSAATTSTRRPSSSACHASSGVLGADNFQGRLSCRTSNCEIRSQHLACTPFRGERVSCRTGSFNKADGSGSRNLWTVRRRPPGTPPAATAVRRGSARVVPEDYAYGVPPRAGTRLLASFASWREESPKRSSLRAMEATPIKRCKSRAQQARNCSETADHLAAASEGEDRARSRGQRRPTRRSSPCNSGPSRHRH